MFLETIIWFDLSVLDSLNNLLGLSSSSVLTITAEHTIAFNVTRVPIYTSYGSLPGVIPGLCVT